LKDSKNVQLKTQTIFNWTLFWFFWIVDLCTTQYPFLRGFFLRFFAGEELNESWMNRYNYRWQFSIQIKPAIVFQKDFKN
jgi:hypothetical protein